MNVAVLGCGPAGLLVAHAVEQAGGTPHIFSKKQPSVIPGSQYFHEAIPGVTSMYPENHVRYVRLGTSEGYAEKVYGDPTRHTGWEEYDAVYPSWNVPRAYERLWERFEDRIKDREITNDWADLGTLLDYYDKVISTLPQRVICHRGHTFEGVPFWIKPLPVPPLDRGKDIVIYNGLHDDSWYRWSILGDRCSIESTYEPEDLSGWIEGTKAITNDCDCWPGIVRAGRWAKWRHGVLLHHAYRTAVNTMKGART